MLEREITISNKLGLHARASAKLVQTLHGFESRIFMAYRGKEVNAKSIMGVLTLRAEGPDEEAAMAALVDLFERKFDEGQ
jgi:phosphocarrier protein HPr